MVISFVIGFIVYVAKMRGNQHVIKIMLITLERPDICSQSLLYIKNNILLYY